MECEHQMYILYVHSKTVSQSCVHVCMCACMCCVCVCVCVGGGGWDGIKWNVNIKYFTSLRAWVCPDGATA